MEKKDNWYADISPANSSQGMIMRETCLVDAAAHVIHLDGAQLIAASALFLATVWSTAGGYFFRSEDNSPLAELPSSLKLLHFNSLLLISFSVLFLRLSSS